MANHGPTYGLSREIEQKNKARFVLDDAREMLDWMCRATNTRLPKSAYAMCEGEIVDCLKDGTLLCSLIDTIAGAGFANYNKRAKMPFHKMENIAVFLSCARKLGLPEVTCFQTVDLYEGKHMYKVFETIRWMAAMAIKRGAPVPAAKFTYKLSQVNRKTNEAKAWKPFNAHSPMHLGSNKGASQKGMRPYGLARQIIPDYK